MNKTTLLSIASLTMGLLFASGCGPGTTMMMTPPDGMSGGGDAMNNNDATAMGGTCSSLPRPSDVMPTVQRMTCPMMTAGGTLSDGTYTLSAKTLYVGFGGSAMPGPSYDVLRLTGVASGSGTFERTSEQGLPTPVLESGTVTVDATNGRITLNTTCSSLSTGGLDANGSTTYGYTVSAAGALTLFNADQLPEFCNTSTYTR